MLNLYNVKSIILNGNEANKLATFYNEYQYNKDKTLLTVKAGEELFDKKLPETEKDLYRKFVTNMLSNTMTYHTVVNNGITEYRDDVHNILLNVDSGNSIFSFSTAENSKAVIQENEIFISDVIRYTNDLSISKTDMNPSETVYLQTYGNDVHFYCSKSFRGKFNFENMMNSAQLTIHRGLVNGNFNISKTSEGSQNYANIFMYSDETYKELRLNKTGETAVAINIPEISDFNFSDKFFDFENLDTAEVGQFGDWSSFKGNVTFDSTGFNTTITKKSEIITKIKTLMKFSAGVNINLEENSRFTD